jgi:hypothetical protein
MSPLARLAARREQLREAAEQLSRSHDHMDASHIARETVDYLTRWIKSFQFATARLS